MTHPSIISKISNALFCAATERFCAAARQQKGHASRLPSSLPSAAPSTVLIVRQRFITPFSVLACNNWYCSWEHPDFVLLLIFVEISDRGFAAAAG
jgi:hypothetical protein